MRSWQWVVLLLGPALIGLAVLFPYTRQPAGMREVGREEAGGTVRVQFEPEWGHRLVPLWRVRESRGQSLQAAHGGDARVEWLVVMAFAAAAAMVSGVAFGYRPRGFAGRGRVVSEACWGFSFMASGAVNGAQIAVDGLTWLRAIFVVVGVVGAVVFLWDSATARPAGPAVRSEDAEKEAGGVIELIRRLFRKPPLGRQASLADDLSMRYYTMAWWHAVQDGTAVDPGPGYSAHVERVRRKLPAESQPTLDALLSISVHDATLRELRLLPDEGRLRLELDHFDDGESVLIYEPGDDLTDEERANPFLNIPMYEVKTHPVRVSMTYSGVRRLAVVPSAEGALCGPGGYGDLGYCEVDRAAPDGLVHRMLFSSGITLAVEFERFEYQRVRVAAPGTIAVDSPQDQ